jgi:hypothetical protein
MRRFYHLTPISQGKQRSDTHGLPGGFRVPITIDNVLTRVCESGFVALLVSLEPGKSRPVKVDCFRFWRLLGILDRKGVF